MVMDLYFFSPVYKLKFNLQTPRQILMLHMHVTWTIK